MSCETSSKKCPPNCALCFGVTDKKEARLLTQETLRSGSYPDAIARDRNHFSFREGQTGILMLDCDAREDKPAMAIKGYVYDHRASRSTSAKEIAEDSKALNISIDEDTVRARLKEAVAELGYLLPERDED